MSNEFFQWYKFDNDSKIGTIGSEGGIILKDEEYRDSARITLERIEQEMFAITCGIYGSIVHTAYASTNEKALEKYDSMKKELKDFIDKFIDEEDEWFEHFTNKYN